MWVKFMKVGDEGATAVVAVVQHRGVFRWVPNFDQWISDGWLAEDLSLLKPMNTFMKISPDQAAHLVKTLPKLDGRSKGWVLKAFQNEQERMSSAELGLDVPAKVKRPTSDKEIVETIRKAPIGTWVTVRQFTQEQAQVARTWVSEVRTGKKKRLAALGCLEAVAVQQEDGSVEAQVRRVVNGPLIVEKASQLAMIAHGLQKDKAGHPYIDHPRRVAEALESQGESAEVVATGWLHDVLEDTTMTAEYLLGEGIPDEVVAAVVAVTKHHGEPLEEYAERVKTSTIGLAVKFADLADNMDEDRLALLDEDTRERLGAKYAKMIALLGGVIPQKDRGHLVLVPA